MPRKSKEQRNAEIHAKALRQFDDAYNASLDSRENARKARRFVNIRGAQWDWDVDEDFANRMRMEIDLVSREVTRIKNEYRKSRIEAKFLPADGSDADALSDACAGRYRADTWDARGREAREMAFDSAVEGGFGGLRLRAEYEDGEKQRICLESVNDAESTLFFDANAKRKDKSDAEHAFLITPWTRAAFVAEYGEEASSWPEGLEIDPKRFQWFQPEIVFVCEYFIREDRVDKYRVFEGFGGEREEFLADEFTDEDAERMEATGFTEIEPREEEVDQVRKFVMNGAKILKDGELIPGRNIPLIPQYGVRTVIDHQEVFRGQVLKSMDAQIIRNIQISSVAEIAATSGEAEPILLDEQVNPYISEWQEAHRSRYGFRRIAAVRDTQGNIVAGGPVGFTQPPDVPPAVAALIDLTKRDIADQMGNPENGEQLQPDLSGVAMDLAQGRIDMQAYGYMDQAADTERRVAEVWQSMAAEVYVEKGRRLKTMTVDGERASIEIGKEVFDAKTGRLVPEVDFARAQEVEVDVGPTSASRRSAVVRTISGLLPGVADPETQIVLTHVALMNLEGEGMSAVRDWSREKLVAMGVEKPTKKEQAEMEAAAANQKPDPQAQLAEAMSAEAMAKAQKAQADTGLAAARTKESEAKAAATLASIPIEQQKQALETAKAIAGEMRPQEGPANAGQ